MSSVAFFLPSYQSLFQNLSISLYKRTKVKTLEPQTKVFLSFFNPSRLQTLFLFESSQNTLIETRTHMYSEVHILDTKNTKILISKDCPLPFCQILYLIPYKRTLTFSVSFAVYHSSLSFSLSLSIYISSLTLRFSPHPPSLSLSRRQNTYFHLFWQPANGVCVRNVSRNVSTE